MTNTSERSGLLAFAVDQVAKVYLEIADFPTMKAEIRAQMEAAAPSLGLEPEEGINIADREFPDFRAWVSNWSRKKAQEDIDRAVKEAEEEVGAFSRIRFASKLEHDNLLLKLNNYYTLPDDPELETIVRAQNETLTAFAEDSFRQTMAQLQERHRLNLEFCFRGNLIPAETAKKLADLYEEK